MTPIQSIQPAMRNAPLDSSRFICVCWTSRTAVTGHRMRQFKLAIDVLSETQAEVEAWVENGDRATDRVQVLGRQMYRVETAAEEGLFHIDVIGSNGDGRLAALSLMDQHDGCVRRPVYASTSLLSGAGFHAGRCDPPTVNVMSELPASDRKRSG